MILDTDVFVDVIRKHPPALTWLSSLYEMPYLSGIAALESSFGAGSASDLREVQKGLAGFPILWPSDKDVETAVSDFSQLQLAHGIGSLDSIVAALAIRHNMPLATFNVKHFRVINGLAIIQPYTR